MKRLLGQIHIKSLLCVCLFFRYDLLDVLRELRNKENVEGKDEKNTLTFNEVAANVFLTLASNLTNHKPIYLSKLILSRF